MYYDLLTRIKNAEAARKRMVKLPFSNLDLAIGEILVKHGYLKDAKKKLIGKKKYIEVELLPKTEDSQAMNYRIVSKPSRHLYKKSQEMKPVKQGYGIGIISTSQGIMTAMDAKKRHLGGEYLCEVW